MVHLYRPIFGGSTVGAIRYIFQTKEGDLLFHGDKRQCIGFHIYDPVFGGIVTHFKIIAGAAGGFGQAFEMEAIGEEGIDTGKGSFVLFKTEGRDVHVALDKAGAAYYLTVFKGVAAGGAKVDDKIGASLGYCLCEVIRGVDLTDADD